MALNITGRVTGQGEFKSTLTVVVLPTLNVTAGFKGVQKVSPGSLGITANTQGPGGNTMTWTMNSAFLTFTDAS